MKNWIARDIETGTDIMQSLRKDIHVDSLSMNMICNIMIGFLVSFGTCNSPLLFV